MTRLGSIGVAVLAVVGAPSERRRTPSLNLPIEQHVLANGMHLVFAPDASLGDVTVLVRYDVGSADDPAGKDGLAHVVEHLMFSGSKHVPKGEYYRWIDRIGGTALNATTPPGRHALLRDAPAGGAPAGALARERSHGFSRRDGSTKRRSCTSARRSRPRSAAR